MTKKERSTIAPRSPIRLSFTELLSLGCSCAEGSAHLLCTSVLFSVLPSLSVHSQRGPLALLVVYEVDEKKLDSRCELEMCNSGHTFEMSGTAEFGTKRRPLSSAFLNRFIVMETREMVMTLATPMQVIACRPSRSYSRIPHVIAIIRCVLLFRRNTYLRSIMPKCCFVCILHDRDVLRSAVYTDTSSSLQQLNTNRGFPGIGCCGCGYLGSVHHSKCDRRGTDDGQKKA